MLTNYSRIFICFLFICSISSVKCFLPKIINACSRNEPKLEECIINSVDQIRPNLAIGNFGENFTVPQLEPLFIDVIHLKRGSEFNAVFKDLEVNGPSGFVVEKLKADAKKLTFDFIVLLPLLNFTGKYNLNVKLFVITLNGKGDMRGIFKNTRAIVKARGREVQMANGIKAVQFDTIRVKIQLRDSKLHLDNLFNGDPALEEIGNRLVNDNSGLFMEEIIPGLEKTLAVTFTDISNSILATTTYDEMFPNN